MAVPAIPVSASAARAPEIGPPGETREHAFRLRQHARIVRIGAKKTQRLVQALYRTRRAQIGARKPAEQHELGLGTTGAVLVFAAFERAQSPYGHRSIPVDAS